MARVHLFAGPQSNNDKKSRSQHQHDSEYNNNLNVDRRGPSPMVIPATMAKEENAVNTQAVSVESSTSLTTQDHHHQHHPSSSPPPPPQQQQQQHEQHKEPDAASIATLTAILQNAQAAAMNNGGDINDVVGAVAAHLSVKPESIDEKEKGHDESSTSEQQLLQTLLRAESNHELPSKKRKTEMEWIDQATAATALQMLGLSHQEAKPQQPNDTSEDGNNQQHLQQQQCAQPDNEQRSQDMDNVMLVADYPGLSAVDASTLELQHAGGESDQEYKRGNWTPEEDELLIAGIKRFGYGRWKDIANMIPGRKGKQLKQRWDNTLASKFVDTAWLRSKIRGDEEEWQHDIDVEGSAPPSPSFQQNKDDRASSSAALAAAAQAAVAATQSSSSPSSSTDQQSQEHHQQQTAMSGAGDIMQKITEKAKEGNHEAIEALLSQALLGTIHHNSHPHTNTSTSSSSSISTSEALPLEQTISNFADAAALAIYAQQFTQQQQQQQRRDGESSSSSSSAPQQPSTSPITSPTSSSPSAALTALVSNHPYLFPFAQGNGHDTNNTGANNNNHHHGSSSSSAAAVAAAVAAMAASQQGLATNRPPPKPAPRATPGSKRRRSDPALADTQSAAMSIYASAAPITTTINNQTQTVYPCLFPNCGKTFARLYNLKSHSRTHTDDRPFVCEVCQTAFSRNHDLKRHAKIHGGDKPHKCLGCNKTFSRLDALKRHKSNLRNKATCLAP